MKYTVSPKFLTLKKIEPLWFSLWGLFLGCALAVFAEDFPWYLAVASTAILVGLSGGNSWLSSKHAVEALSTHSLELQDNLLVLTESAIRSEIDLASIHRVTIKKRGDKVRSITVERLKGHKDKLPPYENINSLAEELARLLPADKLLMV